VGQPERLPYNLARLLSLGQDADDLIPRLRTKPVIYSIVNLIAAAWVYRFLVTGGWLTNHYQWSDPNVINLVLAIVEPAAVLVVIAYWIWRTPVLHRLLFIFFIVQLVIAAGFLAFIGFFFFFWKPKMM
jgi:hypothetical protein